MLVVFLMVYVRVCVPTPGSSGAPVGTLKETFQIAPFPTKP